MLAVVSTGSRPRIRVELATEEAVESNLRGLAGWSGVQIEIDMARKSDFDLLEKALPQLREICLTGKPVESRS